MLNRVLLRRALAGVLDGNPKPAAVITTVPITADLAASFPGVRWIYYCVDDFAEWPGLDGDTLRRMELDLLRHVATVICVSDVLKRRLAAAWHLGAPADPWGRVGALADGTAAALCAAGAAADAAVLGSCRHAA